MRGAGKPAPLLFGGIAPALPLPLRERDRIFCFQQKIQGEGFYPRTQRIPIARRPLIRPFGAPSPARGEGKAALFSQAGLANGGWTLHIQSAMQNLVNRFHLFVLGVTLAIAGVTLAHVPEGYAFPAHWQSSGADWLWPRDIALVVAPLVQALLIFVFFVIGRMLTKNHFGKVQHILDPALTLLLFVAAACQLGLLMLGIGSDFDIFRVTGFGLAAVLAVLAVVIFEAERHSYGGLRMPWPIPSDRAWRLVHRLTGIASGAAAAVLAWLAWTDAGPGILVIAMALSLIALPLVAGLATLLFSRAG